MTRPALTRDSDTRRMAETGTGSVRSTGSAGPQGHRPDPSTPIGGLNRYVRMLEASASELGIHIEAMIQIQMGRYPSDWSDADKREMAEFHLFGTPIPEAGEITVDQAMDGRAQ